MRSEPSKPRDEPTADAAEPSAAPDEMPITGVKALIDDVEVVVALGDILQDHEIAKIVALATYVRHAGEWVGFGADLQVVIRCGSDQRVSWIELRHL